MDRQQFLENMENVNSELDTNMLNAVVDKCIDNYEFEPFKGCRNLIIVMEEFAECSQQVAKWLRGKGDKISLLEETADALIGIKYIQKICGISDEELNKAVNAKITREQGRSDQKFI